MDFRAVRGWLLFLPATLAAFATLAQQPGSLDTRFVTLPGTETAPGFVLPLAAGKVLTGGSFTNYGGSGRAGMVRLNDDGTVDETGAINADITILPDPSPFTAPLSRPGEFFRVVPTP